MIQEFFADGNTPFAVSILLMLGIAALEGVGMLFGLGFASMLDSLVPDADVDIDLDLEFDSDIDLDADGVQINQVDVDGLGAEGALSRTLGWLMVGKVPVLVLLVLFLTFFGLSGMIIQSISRSIIGVPLFTILAAAGAVFVTIPAMKIAAGRIAKIFPNDETDAISRSALIGRVATITIGKSAKGQPAEARVSDQHGQSHYIMIEPLEADATFEQGTEVLVIKKQGARYLGALNTNTAMTDSES